MKISIKRATAFIVFLFAFPVASFAVINVNDTGLLNTADTAGLPTRDDISIVTGNVINALFGFLGSLFLLLIIAGGIMWMTAAGSEDQIRKAKSMITAAIIGLAVVLLSYTIAKIIGGILGNI